MSDPLTKEIWQEGSALLAERFGKELGMGLSAVYLEQVAAELTGVQYIAGVKLLIREKDATFGYYPSPREIIDAGKGTADALGVAETEAALALEYHWRNLDYSPYGYWLDVARVRARDGDTFAAALLAVGGFQRLPTTSPDRFSYLRREFLDVWRVMARDAESAHVHRQLVDGAETRRLKRGEPARLTPGAVDAAARRIAAPHPATHPAAHPVPHSVDVIA